MNNDPITRFGVWFDEAKQNSDIVDATMMSLGTATPDGKPSVRIVLLKEFDERGFVFYTNLESRKSEEMKRNPHAALCFHWVPLGRQVRIEGPIEPVSAAEADEYFASRPRESQIGAWASAQSRPLDNRETLMAKVNEMTLKYDGRPVPRPPHWSGWRLIPSMIEFWQQGDFRLHDRDVYSRHGSHWHVHKLYP